MTSADWIQNLWSFLQTTHPKDEQGAICWYSHMLEQFEYICQLVYAEQKGDEASFMQIMTRIHRQWQAHMNGFPSISLEFETNEDIHTVPMYSALNTALMHMIFGWPDSIEPFVFALPSSAKNVTCL